MIKLSKDKLNNIIEMIHAIIDVKDNEIKDCALMALVEELEELENSEGIDE